MHFTIIATYHVCFSNDAFAYIHAISVTSNISYSLCLLSKTVLILICRDSQHPPVSDENYQSSPSYFT